MHKRDQAPPQGIGELVELIEVEVGGIILGDRMQDHASQNAKIELIRSVPLFSNCSKRELAEIASLADEIDFPEGKTLIKEAERGREFFVLIEGTVDVRQRGRELASRGRADCFGEIALILDVPRTATVTTTSPVRALVLTDRAFRRLLERSPEIQLKVLRSLAERLAPETI